MGCLCVDAVFHRGRNVKGVDPDVERFYRCQRDGSDIVTSQPSIAALGKLWKDCCRNIEVVYIPMSSGLSGSCETACRLAETSKRACSWWTTSASRSRSANRCWTRRMGAGGRSAAEVRDLLEADALEASIYLMVDNEHLRRGGRVTLRRRP
ncbi:MAG: DegV family protein [Eggerthellaceae bacterium]